MKAKLIINPESGRMERQKSLTIKTKFQKLITRFRLIYNRNSKGCKKQI